jgi:lipopolysaccharide transport system ATP-binding protein
VERFLDTPVKRYSSGMYVRLAFAVAAHLEPDVLIVDEVLAVGDAAFQKKSLGKMEDVSRSGRTVLLVSHNMASIKKLSSSVLYLRDGSVVTRGAADDVIRSYIEEDVAGQASIEIPEAMHRVKSAFQIRKIELLDESGTPAQMFRRGEAITIRLTAASSEPVKGARVGIALIVEGVRITTMHTQPLDADSVSELQIDCTMPPDVLLPNVYGVDVGAHDHATGRGLDWITGASTFEVLQVAVAGAVADEKELGVVRIEPEWRWRVNSSR